MPFSSLEDKKNQLIRRARDGSAFTADFTADAITAITTTGSDLAALPAGYADLGLTSTDGISYARTTTVSEVNSFGRVEPSRSDVTKDVVTMTVTAQQTSLQTIGMDTGVDTSGLLADHTTGEVQIAKPDRPALKDYRVLAIFLDADDTGAEIYIARFMPKARITGFGEQKYNDGDGEYIGYQYTFTGLNDATVGYSHKWFWGGPGWVNLLADMGITQA